MSVTEVNGVVGVRREVSTASPFPQYLAAAADIMMKIGEGKSCARFSDRCDDKAEVMLSSWFWSGRECEIC